MRDDSSHPVGWGEEKKKKKKQSYRNKMQWGLEGTEISNSSVVYFKTQDRSHLFNCFLICFRF